MMLNKDEAVFAVDHIIFPVLGADSRGWRRPDHTIVSHREFPREQKVTCCKL